MASLPPSIAVESAILRQNVALSVVKQAADADQQIANILADSARSAPVSGSRGVNVNTSA